MNTGPDMFGQLTNGELVEIAQINAAGEDVVETQQFLTRLHQTVNQMATTKLALPVIGLLIGPAGIDSVR